MVGGWLFNTYSSHSPSPHHPITLPPNLLTSKLTPHITPLTLPTLPLPMSTLRGTAKI
ncbi:hypothetical protein [Fischerella thermalis]|uniref:hypothetical protein n=1 Tax=Fischerella thermalis TaxID=372787 RepID=UPI00307CCF53